VRLSGTEALTFEVGASLPPSRAREVVPARFELEQAAGVPRGSVLFFRMTGLVMRGLPFPSFDYCEALWRVGVVFEGKPAWFAVACDIDHPIVRALGARIVRYPTRAAKILTSEARWKVEAEVGGSVELRVSVDGSAVGGTSRASSADAGEIPALRRTFVSSGKRVYEIPWDEVAPTRARSAQVTVVSDALVQATFGDGAKLDDMGVVHRGRIHMCGGARRLPD